ncbi:MAG: nucleoside hydrolase [Candidatus Methylacidiphilales bacterium]|nr:nucleoside hydrolase [Candidatus Methylacidiphilales bacterium]
MTKRIPVILDTDIGSDIDDTWALAMLLNSPEVDVRLIVSATGDTLFRAKLIAKFLQATGHDSIPLGIGVAKGDKVVANAHGKAPEQRLATWITDYDLSQYPGAVAQDGVDALIQAVRQSDEIITILGIGPLTNIAEALRRAPDIAAKCRFVGMQGSINRGYKKETCVPEYNVFHDVEAARATFAAPWQSMTITPLDTCETIVLREGKYRTVAESSHPLAATILEQYRLWAAPSSGGRMIASSCLFDTVAVYLVYSTDCLEMKEMKLAITDDGRTVSAASGAPVNVAIAWKNLASFEDFLVQRLTVDQVLEVV